MLYSLALGLQATSWGAADLASPPTAVASVATELKISGTFESVF